MALLPSIDTASMGPDRYLRTGWSLNLWSPSWPQSVLLLVVQPVGLPLAGVPLAGVPLAGVAVVGVVEATEPQEEWLLGQQPLHWLPQHHAIAEFSP